MKTTNKPAQKLATMLRVFNVGAPEQTAADLIEWYNVREEYLNNYHIKQLARLAKKGQFRAWYCPSCSARVYEGDPDDWDHFQGVCQVDRVSYPGREDNQNCCDHCRCFNKPARR